MKYCELGYFVISVVRKYCYTLRGVVYCNRNNFVNIFLTIVFNNRSSFLRLKTPYVEARLNIKVPLVT
jgi:hypothetical protein